MSVSPASLVNYKVDWKSHYSIFFLENEMIYKETKTSIFIFVWTTILYEYTISPENEFNIFFDNTRMRIKIYYVISYIANEGRHVRINLLNRFIGCWTLFLWFQQVILSVFTDLFWRWKLSVKVRCQIYCVNFESLTINYHSSSYQTCCYFSHDVYR